MANLLERGAFLISIDTEMAWGVVHRGPGTSHYTYRSEREVIEVTPDGKFVTVKLKGERLLSYNDLGSPSNFSPKEE